MHGEGSRTARPTIYGLKDIKGVRRESNIYANYLAGAFRRSAEGLRNQVMTRRIKTNYFMSLVKASSELRIYQMDRYRLADAFFGSTNVAITAQKI